MAGTYPDLDAAMYSKLAGTAAVTAIVGSGTAARIYNLQAPAGAALDYIIFYAGSEIVPNTQLRDDLNAVYRVDCWGLTRARAEALSAVVFSALHKETLTVAGWTNYWMRCEGKTDFVANVDGKQFYRRVWDVRIRASKD